MHPASPDSKASVMTIPSISAARRLAVLMFLGLRAFVAATLQHDNGRTAAADNRPEAGAIAAGTGLSRP